MDQGDRGSSRRRLGRVARARPQGHPAISYGAMFAAALARWDGSQWSLVEIPDVYHREGSAPLALTFDSGGELRVAVISRSDLQMAHWDDGAWQSESVGRRACSDSGPGPGRRRLSDHRICG